MSPDQTLPAWALLVLAAVVVLVVLAATAVLAVAQRRARAAGDRVTALEHELAELRAGLARLEETGARAAAPVEPAAVRTDDREYVITGLGEAVTDDADPGPAPVVEPRLFADALLQETVVQSVSLAHGLRRALAPETRNRIRFEMRREVKRSRKQRRADSRRARRAWDAQQRAAGGAPGTSPGMTSPGMREGSPA
ncbi:hypothetical protein [Nocardioides sp. SYSU D00038]|uniref:hypothetical protein n=1 Tax=Nocardioides sp. SYSU D00038 TaxID=2812554 RepID=UPI001967F903|nr:hypothetical protein [Nocardioides sp. SYSU D00038]